MADPTYNCPFNYGDSTIYYTSTDLLGPISKGGAFTVFGLNQSNLQNKLSERT